MHNYAMLQRNLIFTGIARGKKLVVLIIQALALAIDAKYILCQRALDEIKGMV